LHLTKPIAVWLQLMRLTEEGRKSIYHLGLKIPLKKLKVTTEESLYLLIIV